MSPLPTTQESIAEWVTYPNDSWTTTEALGNIPAMLAALEGPKTSRGWVAVGMGSRLERMADWDLL